MDPRAKDVESFLRALSEAMAAPHDGPALLALAERAIVARAFRSTDQILGLDAVDPARLAALDEAIGRALVRVGEGGDPRGFTRLGELFAHWGEPKRAVLAFERAVRDGDPRAGERLATLVWELRDETRAPLAAAALRSVPDVEGKTARYLEALFAFHGFGRPVDLAESVAVHRRAAEAGHVGAMFELYAMLSQGLGVPAAPDEAATFCRRAAEGGHVRAMYNLGAFHATGAHVERDPKKALLWYLRAAEAGHGRAAATAAIMLLAGEGAPVDRARARSLLDLARRNGFDPGSLLERAGYAAFVASLPEGETPTQEEVAGAAQRTKDHDMNTNATVEAAKETTVKVAKRAARAAKKTTAKVKKAAAKAVKAAKKTTANAAKAIVEAVKPKAKKAAKKAAKKPAAKKAAKPAAKKAAKK